MFAKLLATCAVMSGSLASVAASQNWNSAPARTLVERATALRARQLADTGLVDYHATAHGYVTFLAQLGDGLREPPRIVRADQLALEVYWRAPNFSKQIIEGRRDTLLLPTDIVYHRDHLGIVQNNFPNLIRLGEGDEVRDVPHPLSQGGLALYDFAIDDSLTLGPPPVRVYRVLVRPHDPNGAGIVGAIYVEPREGQVVRMAFSFTRKAFLQPELEDISVVLENALVEGRFWLPNVQEIEIRRTGTWLDAPARGIIRARWKIAGYIVNQDHFPVLFGGPEIVSIDSVHLAHYPWRGGILDSLPPDTRVATDADMARVRDYVRNQALGQIRRTALSARSASDFVRVDRAEGLALGAGVTQGFGDGFAATLRARYGFSDHQGKGEADVSWRWFTLSAYRDYRDVGDVPEASRLINSIAAQEFGADHSDPYDTRGVAAFATVPIADWSLRVGVRRERQDSLALRASPTFGRFAPMVPARSLWATLPSVTVSHPTSLGPLGTEIRFDATVTGAFNSFARASAVLSVERPEGADRLVTRTTIAGVTAGPVPIQDDVFLGGPITGPGYAYHEFVGRAGATEHVEWQFPIPGPAITLGRYGTTPASFTLAPFAHVLYTTHGGYYPSAGLGLLALFNLVRFDVARGFRRGAWTFAFDLDHALWPVL